MLQKTKGMALPIEIEISSYYISFKQDDSSIITLYNKSLFLLDSTEKLGMHNACQIKIRNSIFRCIVIPQIKPILPGNYQNRIFPKKFSQYFMYFLYLFL